MKRLILFAALTAGFSIITRAQIAFGPEVGLNMSSMNFDDTTSFSHTTSSATGFKAGVIVDLGFTKKMSLQPGIFYSVKGGVVNAIEIKTNYIEVPVNLQYQVVDVKVVKVFVGAGPYFAYALSGKQKFGGKETDLNIGTATTDFIKASDLGVNVNAGAMLMFGLFARVQYGFGLTNTASVPEARTIKNGNFSVSVGYLLGRTR